MAVMTYILSSILICIKLKEKTEKIFILQCKCQFIKKLGE